MQHKLQSLKSGIKWGSFYAISLILSKIIRGLIIPKILDPSSYGLFSSISLFTRYLQFADLGANAYFIKEIPHLHFNKSASEKQAFVDQTYSLIALSFVLIALYLGGTAYFYKGSHAEFYGTALVILIPITILAKLKDFYISYAIGIQNYRKSVFASVVNNYVGLVLVCAGVFLYGALGGVLGMLIAEILVFVYVLRSVRLNVTFFVSKSTFRTWKQNIKQLMVSMSDLFNSTIDQIVILMAFDVAALGFYAFGLTFSWLLESISEIYNTASYPKLMAITKTSRTEAADLIDRTLRCYLLTSLLVVPAAIYMIEILVTFYFTQYLNGLTVYSVMMFLGLSRGAMAILRRGYIALDKEKNYVIISLWAGVIYAVCMTISWWMQLSFTKLIEVIVAANLFSLLALYFVLGKMRDNAFWINILLLIVFVAFVASYQNLFRSEIFSAFVLDSGSFALLLMTGISAVIVYADRAVIRAYLQ